MQPDAEHQEDHTDLCELCGEVRVRNDSGSERAECDSGDQISDERGNTDTDCDEAECEREHECGGDRRN